MMVFEYTAEAAPIVFAMISLLVISAIGVAVEPTFRLLRGWLRTSQIRFTIRRPALGHSR